MEQFEKLFTVIESKKDEYLTFLKDVAEIESPTSYKAGVDAVGIFFAEKANAKGWKVEIYQQKAAGNVVVITMNPDINKAPFCLSGHMDTVHPIGTFGTPCVKTVGNKMIGPGVTDCKGGCVNGFWAMDALSEVGYRNRPIKLLLQSDEETNSRESGGETVRYIIAQSQNAVAFLNLEGCITGGVTLERKGIAKFLFTVKGVSEHASKCYLGASAIAEAAHKILALETYKDKDGITASCGTIRGGTVPNTVPGECVFTLDTRFKDDRQYADIKRIVTEIASQNSIAGTSCHAEEISMRVSMSASEKNYALWKKANETLQRAGLAPLRIQNSTGGSDAAYITRAGIPVIDSIGAIGGSAHRPDEYILIDGFPLATKRVAAIIADM